MVFLNKLSKKERIGLFISVGFVVLALLDRLIISPINNRFEQINREIKISEKQLAHSLRNLNQKDIISREYQKYIQYVKKSASDEEETAKILGEIEELARSSAVYLVDMKPQTPRKVDFYKEYTVEIEAEAEMESLVNFLHQLNTSSHLLRAEKLRLNLKGKESSVIKAAILITKVLIP
jgi:DNA-binding HxlR family transcriptional regulator